MPSEKDARRTSQYNDWGAHAFRSHRPESNRVMLDINTPDGNFAMALPEDVAKHVHHKLGEAINDG